MRRLLSSLTLAAVLTAAVAVPAFAGGDNNSQYAENMAVIEQSLASVSGDALASKWSFAKSGESEAEAEAKISQKNIQVILNDIKLKFDLD